MNKSIIVKLSEEFFQAAVIVLILYYVIFPLKITGESMKDTLRQGDRVLMSRCAAMLNLYNKDDIVVIKYNTGYENIKIVKRIAALGGDEIAYKEGALYINGTLIEGYDADKDLEYAFTLSEDEVFVLGDNPIRSVDSREFGAVNKKDITGIVLFRFYPLSRFGKIDG